VSLDSFHVVPPASHARASKIALLGFGTVGSAVARRLTGADRVRNLELTHIVDRRADHKRVQFGDTGVSWASTIDDILHSDIDIVVEAIGGLDTASDWIRRALEAGKSVVTANKQVIAHHGPALWTLAARQGRQLRFEAAVGGAMPIIRAVGDGLAGDRITRIVGILNGTTNAVLSRMEALECSLEAALADARARGYAEANPSADLDGDDARAKLAILCGVAFGLRVDPVAIAARSTAGITVTDFDRARRCGRTIRQLAYAAYDRATSTLTAWVAPIAVPRGSIFARTTGPQNAALITGAHAGDVGVFGVGAGGDATAVAVLSDLAAIAKDRAAIVPSPQLSVPRHLKGFTTLNAETAEHAEGSSLCDFSDLRVDRCLTAEAV
jgi:homoserine dehydrogenase